jgi:hypothetical protein
MTIRRDFVSLYATAGSLPAIIMDLQHWAI